MKFNRKWLCLIIIPLIIFSLCWINSSSVSTVLLAIKGTITDGNLIKFSGITGTAKDAGITSANVEDAVTKKHTSGSETCAGDVSGTVGSNTVDKIKGYTVDTTDIANQKILKYNSTSGNWECEDDAGGVSTFVELTDTPGAYDNGKYAKSTADGVIWDTPAGAGEVNTASNIGTGTGIFKQKTGVDLEFKKLIAGSSKITITDVTAEIQVYDTNADTNGTENLYEYTKWAQSFTAASSYIVTDIKLELMRVGAPPATLDVSLYATDGSGFPTGDALATGSIPTNGITTEEAGDWYTAALSVGVDITISEKYAIVLENGWTDISNQIKWRRRSSDVYANGNIMYYDADWVDIPTYDAGFACWGAAAADDYVTFDIVESEIRLDDLKATEDNADLDASTTAHGLLKKLDNIDTHFMNGQGAWVVPAGGYTNLTSFVDQTAWRLFYSNADGDVIELPLGTDGQVLNSNGVDVAPTFEDPAGAGEVNTASNIGAEVEIFKQKTAEDLEFRTLKANSNKITISNTTDAILKISNEVETNNDYVYSGQQGGQYWTAASTYTLGIISVYMKRTGDGSVIRMQVYAADANGYPTGGELGSIEIDCTGMSTDLAWIDWDLTSDDISITNGEKYCWYMSGEVVGNGVVIRYANTDQIADAWRLWYATGSWNKNTGQDDSFKLYSAAGALNYVKFDVVETEMDVVNLLSTTTVAFNADADTTLYTVPAGKRCVLTKAIVVAAGDAGATTTVSIGQDTAETDFIPANTLSNLDAEYDSVILMLIPNTTPLKIKSYAADTVIEAQVANQSGVVGNTIYLFGILY